MKFRQFLEHMENMSHIELISKSKVLFRKRFIHYRHYKFERITSFLQEYCCKHFIFKYDPILKKGDRKNVLEKSCILIEINDNNKVYESFNKMCKHLFNKFYENGENENIKIIECSIQNIHDKLKSLGPFIIPIDGNYNIETIGGGGSGGK